MNCSFMKTVRCTTRIRRVLIVIGAIASWLPAVSVTPTLVNEHGPGDDNTVVLS